MREILNLWIILNLDSRRNAYVFLFLRCNKDWGSDQIMVTEKMHCNFYGMTVWFNKYVWTGNHIKLLQESTTCFKHWHLKVPAWREHVSGTWGLSACELIEAVTFRSTTCQQRLLEISGIEILLESMKILDLFCGYIAMPITIYIYILIKI